MEVEMDYENCTHAFFHNVKAAAEELPGQIEVEGEAYALVPVGEDWKPPGAIPEGLSSFAALEAGGYDEWMPYPPDRAVQAADEREGS